MIQFPPIPTWDSLHPLIIHFPIVLLLLSPLFILVSAVLSPPRGQPYMIAALGIMLLGTASLYVSASTGVAAAELADRTDEINGILAAHENLAAETKILFTGLSVILLGMLAIPRLLRRQETRLSSTFMPLAFLALYSVGILFLVNTAHAGGRLVHEFGVHTVIPATNSPSGTAAAAEVQRERFTED